VVEFFVNPECLGQSVEILVEVFRAGEAAADHQWSSVCGHPQLEVSVMRHCHKSGECWSPEDGMVLQGPVDDLEFDLLLSEVRGGSEDDIQVYHP
jgi:hypothetical protein